MKGSFKSQFPAETSLPESIFGACFPPESSFRCKFHFQSRILGQISLRNLCVDLSKPRNSLVCPHTRALLLPACTRVLLLADCPSYVHTERMRTLSLPTALCACFGPMSNVVEDGSRFLPLVCLLRVLVMGPAIKV